MAKQDIKKQLDFLRILFYEGGAWDRVEMARRLHLQPSTYDKYLREWRQKWRRCAVAVCVCGIGGKRQSGPSCWPMG